MSLKDALDKAGIQRTPEQESLLAEALSDGIGDVIIECDPSPKMIVHEPYRTVMNAVADYLRSD